MSDHCPNCKSQLLPNLNLEGSWQIVRCQCGALVEIGHGDPVVRLPATFEDFREAAARHKWYDAIHWRRYGPVYQRLDFEFWEQVNRENSPPEPPSEAAKDLQDIKGELRYIRERLDRREPDKGQSKSAF